MSTEGTFHIFFPTYNLSFFFFGIISLATFPLGCLEDQNKGLGWDQTLLDQWIYYLFSKNKMDNVIFFTQLLLTISNVKKKQVYGPLLFAPHCVLIIKDYSVTRRYFLASGNIPPHIDIPQDPHVCSIVLTYRNYDPTRIPTGNIIHEVPNSWNDSTCKNNPCNVTRTPMARIR